MKTALIERYPTLGGTCLNVGCIPSKALLDSSEHYHNAHHHFAQHGIQLQNLGVDFKQMVRRKDKVVSDTVGGVQFLMKKNKIDVFHGHGALQGTDLVQVNLNEGGIKKLQGLRIIIATGSKPATIPGVVIDKLRVISSTEALSLPEIPKKMVVIGGGIIGLEMGSVYARLGSEVVVYEYMDRLIAGMDHDLGKELQKILQKQLGIQFRLKHRVQKVENDGTKVSLHILDDQDQPLVDEADYCLVAVGRKPYTEQLGLQNVGIQLDERGRIPVDDYLHTGVGQIYAIGDVVRGAMLAHKASDEGVFVAEYLAGQHPHINYRAIPSVVYTWPEVSSVGYSEQELQELKIPYKTGKFPFMASGRARAAMDTDGFVKVLAHQETDEVLGVHMIGARCADLIIEGVFAIEYRSSAEDLGIFSHPHPTFTESVKEAALAATANRAIHI
jgi:dihydrolipoamide dehydrogenase